MRVFDEIIPFVSSRLERVGSAILVGSHERVPLRKESFLSLSADAGVLVFIDAGNGEVLSGANVSVQFVRLYSARYERNVRVSRELREFFLVVVAVQKGLDVGFEAVLFNLDGAVVEKFLFDAFDPVLCFGGRRAEPSSVVNYVRKLLELRFAVELCDKMSAGEVLVRDGDLEARGELLESVVRILRSSAQRRGVVVLGLSKTSTLCTDSGNSALFAVGSMAPSGAWAYFTGGSVAFVRLHQGSGYIFRCDVFPHDREFLPIAWSALAANSCDPAFLGYPYGLLDADKFAQVPKSESAQLRARFEVQSKGVFRALESAVDAHGILDSL